MTLRLLANAGAQTTVALPITAGATSLVGQSTAAFPSPATGQQSNLIILDTGNPAYNAATPLATPYEYCYYTANNTGTNTISSITRGVAGTTAKAFFAGATIAVGWLAEDILSSAPWKFDEQSPSGVSTITIPAAGSIPASYLGVNFRHITIEWLIRSSAAAFNADLYFQLNGDTATSYVGHTLSGSNSAAVYTNPPSGGVATGIVGLAPAGSMAAGLFGHGSIKFTDFAQSVGFHIGRGESHYMQAGTTTSAIYLRSASWNQLVPITSILLGLSGGTFVAGSRITTYLWP